MKDEFNNDALDTGILSYIDQLQVCCHLFEFRESDEWIRFVDIIDGSIIGINTVTHEVAIKVGGEEYSNLTDKKITQLITAHQNKSCNLDGTNKTKYKL